MTVKLVWSKRTDQGFARIIKYLEEGWTDKEVSNFVREADHFFDLLKENSQMLETSGSHINLYRGPINRLTILTYRFNPKKKEIVLVNIRDARKSQLKK